MGKSTNNKTVAINTNNEGRPYARTRHLANPIDCLNLSTAPLRGATNRLVGTTQVYHRLVGRIAELENNIAVAEVERMTLIPQRDQAGLAMNAAIM